MSRDFFSDNKQHYSNYKQYSKQPKAKHSRRDNDLFALTLFSNAALTAAQFRPLGLALNNLVKPSQIGHNPETQFASDTEFVDLINRIRRFGSYRSDSMNPTEDIAQAYNRIRQAAEIASNQAKRDLALIESGDKSCDLEHFSSQQLCYPEQKLSFCASVLETLHVHMESDFSDQQQRILTQHLGSYTPPIAP